MKNLTTYLTMEEQEQHQKMCGIAKPDQPCDQLLKVKTHKNVPVLVFLQNEYSRSKSQTTNSVPFS